MSEHKKEIMFLNPTDFNFSLKSLVVLNMEKSIFRYFSIDDITNSVSSLISSYLFEEIINP